MNPLSFLRDLLKKLLEQEPARLIAWGGAGLLFAARWLAAQVGIELPPAVVDALTVLGGFLLIELIRRIVYAPATVKGLNGE